MDAIVAIGGAAVTPRSEPTYVVAADGFDELYRREYPGLYGVATAMAGGMNAADDLVQDTMLRAFVHWGKVQRLERPGGWCYRVLLNLGRKWYWRRRSEAAYMARQGRREQHAPGPSGEMIVLCQALRLLPSRPRAVIALHYMGDYSVAEVAAILDVPEGTVRSDLSRGRIVLAAELGV
jgi:RNA polymerase sigma-70 factor (ECF subfamily)